MTQSLLVFYGFLGIASIFTHIHNLSQFGQFWSIIIYRFVRSRDVAMMKWLAATAATDPWNKLVTGKLFFHLLAQKNATQFNFNFENWCSRHITPKWWTNPPKDLNIHETPRSVSFQVRYTSVTGLSAKPVRFATTKAPSEAMSLARHRSKFPPFFAANKSLSKSFKTDNQKEPIYKLVKQVGSSKRWPWFTIGWNFWAQSSTIKARRSNVRMLKNEDGEFWNSHTVGTT